jgi:hypothetical protein
MEMGKKTWAEKFCRAYKDDMRLASAILGSFLEDVDFDVADDYVVLIFEDRSMAGYIKPTNDRKGQAWELGTGER